jgi:transcriptional regulator with XRE-family HTH domain
MTNSSSAFDGLGKALRWIRDKQGKKQYQVADAAGVTKAMLSAYETGKQKPSIDTLEKVMGALRVDLAGLFHAIEMVNERPHLRLVQPGEGLPPALRMRPEGELEAVDVYSTLGVERPLPVVEEQAMEQMLRGFHRLLRHFHSAIHTGRWANEQAAAATPESPPDANE